MEVLKLQQLASVEREREKTNALNKEKAEKGN